MVIYICKENDADDFFSCYQPSSMPAGRKKKGISIPQKE
jgi:hypothetical protein